jgi:LysR family transcriptional regulator, benzoate and cis,cis-muconate-responsive activator of ben and cat genes
MDLRHLRYFHAIAEELSFSRAAGRLNVVQPALSRALKELEAELGVELIARTQRRVAVTAAGKVLRDETALLMERLDATIRRVRRTAAGEEGELRLGYIGPPTQDFLGPVLAAFAKHCPAVSVVLEERTPERVWEMVASGRLDVGLTRPVLAHAASSLKTHVLRAERLCVAIPRVHPWATRRSLPWRRLQGEPLIVLARREGAGLHDEILAACRAASFTPRLVHTPSLIGTVLRYVEAGLGLGIIPESIGAAELAKGWRLLPLTPTASVPLVMVWNDDTAEPPTHAFRDILTGWLGSGRSKTGSL